VKPRQGGTEGSKVYWGGKRRHKKVVSYQDHLTGIFEMVKGGYKLRASNKEG